jgi:hypothetical protein
LPIESKCQDTLKLLLNQNASTLKTEKIQDPIPLSLAKGKIGYVPLKDPNFRKIPSKDWALEKYHRNLAPSLISTIAVKST